MGRKRGKGEELDRERDEEEEVRRERSIGSN